MTTLKLAQNDDAITIASGNNAITTSSTSRSTHDVQSSSSTNETLLSFVPLVLIFVVFYFFIMRPQIKKQKEHESMIKTLKAGDKVVTSGGFITKIVKLEDEETMQVEIAPNVKARMLRSNITEILDPKASTAKS